MELLPLEEAHRADGVFEGGGVKGIAFAGAIAAAEREAGVQEWVNLAGTSAGAIVSALLAVRYDSAGLQRILGAAQYPRFPDCGPAGLKLGGAYSAIFRRRGLAPGSYFTKWFSEQLAASPLAEKVGRAELTFGDLKREDLPPREAVPEISDQQYERAKYRLHVITSDISSGRMVILPDDLPNYDDPSGAPLDKDSFRIVDAVRMSMSYPFLFAPVELRHEGRPYYMVDGGLLSNFPIWLFDSAKPKRPTWGFRLHGGLSSTEGLPYRKIPRPLWEVPLLKAMFSAATEAWDRRQLSVATASRTVSLPTHDISTTNFDITADDAKNLYEWGNEAATKFFNAPAQQAYLNSFGAHEAAP